MNNNYLLIMAGGAGTRFWPFSRESYPKQFHDILGTGRTLLQQTAERFEGIIGWENIFVLTTVAYRDIVKQQLPFLSDQQILCEPCRRNTAPCVAYAAYKIMKHNPDANMVVCPSDHLISKESEFLKKIKLALQHTASHDDLLTLGIKPHRPDTGYGYIQYEAGSAGEINEVLRFEEKPPLEKAMAMLQAGNYLWNAGIFIWHVKALVAAFAEYAPALAAVFTEGEPYYYTPMENTWLEENFPGCESISLDYAIMEKATRVKVLPADIGWSDLGTWKSLHELGSKDEGGNVLEGKLFHSNLKNSIVKLPDDKLAVIHGLQDYIVAEYNNALMICPIAEEQKVKEFVHVAAKFGKEYV